MQLINEDILLFFIQLNHMTKSSCDCNVNGYYKDMTLQIPTVLKLNKTGNERWEIKIIMTRFRR